MRTGPHLFSILIELQKHVLRHFLRGRYIAEEVVRNAVNQSLVLVYDEFEFGPGHLPSKLITAGHPVTTQKIRSPLFRSLHGVISVSRLCQAQAASGGLDFNLAEGPIGVGNGRHVSETVGYSQPLSELFIQTRDII